MALLFGYLFLVAQYESWTVPISVIVSVSGALLGALLGLIICNTPLSIYAQLGLVTVSYTHLDVYKRQILYAC